MLGALAGAGAGAGTVVAGGIPPTPGFWAKLAVLVVAWQSAGPLPTLIAVVGGVFSVLYYLRPLPDLFAAMRGEADADRASRRRFWARSWPACWWWRSASSRAWPGCSRRA